MAQLKDTVVSGSLRATDSLLTTTLQTKIIKVPATAGGTNYSTGTNKYVLLSNGSSAYWGTATVITEVGTISVGKWQGTTVGTAYGGTGNTSYTATRLLYTESATKFATADHIYVLNNYLISNSRNGQTVDVRANGLIIYGTTYGNTVSGDATGACRNLLSNKAGVFRFSDGGPQIIFNTSASFNAQAGALIYTDNDSAATGASFHFVTTESSNDNGGNLTVTAPRFRARAGLTVGQNSDNTSYNLYINGTSYFSNTITSAGNIYISNTSPHIFLQNTNWTKGTTPGANYYSALEFHTSGDYASNKRVGLLEVNIDTSNNVWMNIWTVPNAADSTSWSGIRMKRTSTGTLTIYNQGYTEVSGHLFLSGEYSFHTKIARKKADGGGWAYSPFYVIDNANTIFARIGVYGNANTMNYMYIGAGDYNTTTHIRIDASGHLIIPNDGIYYQGTKEKYRMIRFIDNTSDNYGNGISIGGGGLAIFGSGESADTMVSNLGYTGGSEVTVIASDGNIRFFPGNNSYDASAELTMSASRFWAGVNGNTAREAQVGCQSGAGQMYMWCAAATNGARGIWLPAHGTGSAHSVFTVDTNNAVTFYGTLSGNCTGSAGSVAWANTGHPSTFPPSAHTHTWLELAPGNKAASTGAAQSDDTGPFTVRWYSVSGKIAQQPTQYGFLITCAASKGSQEQHALWLEQCDGHIYHRGTNGGNNASPPAFKMLWQRGDAVTSAVWNDYAEYRTSTCNEPGYCVFENGDDTLSKTTKRLQHFAGITSDTWGFAQGETETAKTPIAVSGRVLAYTYRNRNEYQPGDCVCAAPDGTVDIMTRDEIMLYPDKIVGTVSCIPEYEEWGSGEGADRPAVKINGRIWIKVK